MTFEFQPTVTINECGKCGDKIHFSALYLKALPPVEHNEYTEEIAEIVQASYDKFVKRFGTEELRFCITCLGEGLMGMRNE